MIIRLKLVGSNEETDININSDRYTITDIFNYLMEHNLSYDEVSKIKFFCNGKNISNDINTINIVAEDIIPRINMYVNDDFIKNELIKYIFNNEVKEDYEELTSEENNKHNEEIIKLFSDSDFTYLLKICLTKPELINKVSSYISNGNITTEIKNIQNDEFKYPEIYIKIINILEKLNIFKNELEIKSIINHFEGNINLTLRFVFSSCL